MPTFCRHNRLIQNCPICAREQAVELRPVVSSSAPRVAQPPIEPPGGRRRAERTGSRNNAGLRVHRLARGADDGYGSPLVPGLRSSEDAGRLADEIAFADARLATLEGDPPALFAEVARGDDVEESIWLAFLIAYLGPLEAEDPFAAIAAAFLPWHSGEMPDLGDVAVGPRGAHAPALGTRTIGAYRAWAARAGSQHGAFSGEAAWTPERRFDRIYERLALPGLHRAARFELLVHLGWLGLIPLRPASLKLGGADEVTVAAKRVFGIGDPLLLDRRAAALAQAAAVPIAALDLALFNWGRGERFGDGIGPERVLARRLDVLAALGV